MWILECDGDFLQGKRLWLKPGQRYLFGRVKKDGVRFLIEHKSISRKHFVVEVDKVKEGDGAHVHTRSKVTVTDLKSKGGTQVDGKPLKDGSQVLDKVEHYLKPGSYPASLRIKWNPVVLSFSLSSKDMKTKDFLRPKRDRLEQLDIKTILEYIPASTTHVVAAKRNTAKGLQALIHGKYIVDEPYIDALVYAAAPADLEEEENASPLELNFDAAWPKPKDFLPPAGKEPTVQPPDAYAPNPQRENIFESYTFVFLDQAQYETLMPVINAGHGKALLFNVTPSVTTVEEALRYMRNAAGDKGFGYPPDDTNHGGVVMVRHNKVEQQRERWFKDLLDGVSFALDQRSIAQGEFLDAILANEPTRLRRSLEYSGTVEGRVPPSPTATSVVATAPPQASPSQHMSPTKADLTPAVRVQSPLAESVTAAHQAPEVTVEPPKKRSRLRGPAIPRIKAFDDEFDADSIPSFVADDDEQSPDGALQSQSSVAESRYESLPNIKEEKEAARGTSLKRSRHPSESEEDMVDELLPAATAMKRRKLEMERRNGGAAKATQAKAVPLPLVKPKKPTKEVNVREAARKKREAEEEAERREQERDQKALETIEHVKPANLVVIEEMPLRVRPDLPSGANGGTTNDRWDERWNGRQNFKKFRRNGTATVGPRRNVRHVIVPLVEVKKHSYGIGEQYWHHDDKESESKKKKKTTSQSQGETESQPRLRGTLQTETIQAGNEDHEEEQHTSPTTTRLQQEAEEIVGAIDVDSPRRTRLGDKTQGSQIARPKKRPAAASGSGAAAPKRQKTIQTRPALDDSDSDDLKFRFRSRNK